MTDQYMPVRRREPTDGEFRSFHLGKVHTPSHPLFDDGASMKVRYTYGIILVGAF